MAQLIATGIAAATSGDFDVAAGESSMVNLFVASGQTIPPGCAASIQLKGSNGVYVEVGVLDDKHPALLVDGPGTFRVVKKNSTVAFGVDQA